MRSLINAPRDIPDQLLTSAYTFSFSPELILGSTILTSDPALSEGVSFRAPRGAWDALVVTMRSISSPSIQPLISRPIM
ncbi:MAG: hypothetical protein AAFY50_10690 [Cyanobacteria bacterium J06648_1]